MDQDGDIGYSQIQCPSQEDQRATLHRQETIVKISKPKSEADSPHCTQRD